MTLKKYRKKRNFQKTPEPQGKGDASSSERLFVIQKHAATQLHYDLRLELDGVLKSWALPKGPSLNPGERRLAVHVEDHPIEYGSFEGIIPKEEYGGGTVMLWDTGTWIPAGDPREDYRKGRLHFEIHGKKLKGSWRLFKIGGKNSSDNGKNWLLIKSKDLYADNDPENRFLVEKSRSVSTGRTMEEIALNADAASDQTKGGIPDPSSLKNAQKAKMPTVIHPQLPTLIDAPPDNDHWIHEIKYDGYRIIAFLKNGAVRLVSRNDRDWTGRFPSIVDALSRFPAEKAVIDGEIVIQLPDGITDFQSLQNALKGVRSSGTMIYYLFDILHYNGYDLKSTPLAERKNYLKQCLAKMPPGPSALRFSDHVEGSGDKVYDHACRLSLEGIISKDRLGAYLQKRSRTWVKVKCQHRQEFVIGGYTEPSGTRTAFGALLIGVYDDEDNLRYCGKVGTGFNNKQLASLKKIMSGIERKTPPFVNPPNRTEARKVHWISPRLVAEVAFSGWTREQRLRHPVYKELREDKAAGDIRRETILPKQAAVREKPENPDNYHPKNHKQTPTPTRMGKIDTSMKQVRLTNAERIYYPELGVTKADLADYYQQISCYILPHVADRPLSLLRCPRGRGKDCFYQKHFSESLPDFVRGVKIKEKNSVDTYIVIENIEGIISLVQLGVLEFHPWNARKDRIERPDQMIMDLDPAPEVGLKEVVESTILLHDFFIGMGLRNFLKTSGGKGFHVVVPLIRRSGWDELKTFAQAVAFHMTRLYPDQFVPTMSKKKRKGKIFLDYFRNNRGATSIAPYSTRAKAGAPISTPLAWEELTTETSPDKFRIDNILNRINKLKDDPWKDFSSTSQSITKLMKNKVGL